MPYLLGKLTFYRAPASFDKKSETDAPRLKAYYGERITASKKNNVAGPVSRSMLESYVRVSRKCLDYLEERNSPLNLDRRRTCPFSCSLSIINKQEPH